MTLERRQSETWFGTGYVWAHEQRNWVSVVVMRERARAGRPPTSADRKALNGLAGDLARLAESDQPTVGNAPQGDIEAGDSLRRVWNDTGVEIALRIIAW